MTAQDLPPKPRVGRRLAATLDNSCKLQDVIYSGHMLTKAGYGWLPDGTQFGARSRLRLKEICSSIDSGPLENLVFLTGTLPGSHRDALVAISEWSSWVVTRLTQWLRDKFPLAKYCGVWEFQRRGALHMHVIVRTETSGEARALLGAWKSRWIALLDGVKRRSGKDVWKRNRGDSWESARWVCKTDAQRVEKSATRYLSKYLSKSACKLRSGAAFPPVRWWFASQTLKQEAQAARRRIEFRLMGVQNVNDLFERVSAQIADMASVAYPLRNRFDITAQGIIGLMPPAIAGAVWRSLAEAFQPLRRSPPAHDDRGVPGIYSVVSLVAGRLLQSG